MDLIKIGTFLSELRHESNLTQAQLGEKIGVTNKTISRWENGNYLPPVEMLQQLSMEYNVSINELLAGERLSDSSYKEKAEENIKKVLSVSAFTVKEKQEFFKKKWKKDHRFQRITTAILLMAVFIGGVILDNGLQLVGYLLVILSITFDYNRMMEYVEGNVYDGMASNKELKK
ncbi:MAG: helix-turn-helix domain-containing protein [Lachnospiraceae bacterium]|nr:helix-turn-helix domain-containing protein [Lachnospiraceae bacterium]